MSDDMNEKLYHLHLVFPDSYENRHIHGAYSTELCKSTDLSNIELIRTTLIVSRRYDKDDLQVETTSYYRDNICHYCEHDKDRFKPNEEPKDD